jgi:hypothetical protein
MSAASTFKATSFSSSGLNKLKFFAALAFFQNVYGYSLLFGDLSDKSGG